MGLSNKWEIIKINLEVARRVIIRITLGWVVDRSFTYIAQ